MKIAVFGTNISDEYKSKAEEVIHSFIANGFNVSIFKNFKTTLASASFSIGNLPEFTEIKENSFDILLSLGGDGTFLKCAHLCYATNTPILGINFGKLGFLAQTNPDDIDFIIKDIQNKKFSIRQRTVLDFSYATDKEILNGIGLNETPASVFEIEKYEQPLLGPPWTAMYSASVFASIAEVEPVIITR